MKHIDLFLLLHKPFQLSVALGVNTKTMKFFKHIDCAYSYFLSGIAYLIWKTFFRRTQNEESGRKFCRGPLIRASSFDGTVVP